MFLTKENRTKKNTPPINIHEEIRVTHSFTNTYKKKKKLEKMVFRISVLVCLVLLVTIGVMVSVSLADNNEEKSTDLKKVKGGVTDRSISKVHDDDHDDDNDGDDDHDDDNDHDNDNNDHDNDGDDDHDDDDNKDDGDDDDDKKKTLGVHELKKGNLTAKFTNRDASIMSLLFPNKNG